MPALEARSIVKSFGTVRALRGASFQAFPAQVTALVGDNGAGKSTLVKTLSGVFPPDDGQILVDGNTVTMSNPRDAASLGIETVYQDLALAPDLDAAANVFLGRELRRLRILHDQAEMRRQTAARFKELGVGLVQDLRVRSLRSPAVSASRWQSPGPPCGLGTSSSWMSPPPRLASSRRGRS